HCILHFCPYGHHTKHHGAGELPGTFHGQQCRYPHGQRLRHADHRPVHRTELHHHSHSCHPHLYSPYLQVPPDWSCHWHARPAHCQLLPSYIHRHGRSSFPKSISFRP